MSKIRVMVADDTDIAREGMIRVLSKVPEIEIVDTGVTITETIQKVIEQQPDILILDLMWNDDEQAGTDAIRRLKTEAPETKIIAITVYPELIPKAKSAGALTGVNKEISKDQLIREIRSVHALSPPPPPLPQAVAAAASPPFESLTKRQVEVLALIAEGNTDKQIAQALGITESTAKNHVSNILGKLDVPNRARAAVVGRELGLIGTSEQ
jgi:DNA-binding NarL/FixJ family response regulator